MRKLIFERLAQTDEDLYEVALRFLNDTYALNRMLALRYLYDSPTEDQLKIDVVKACLTDKNAAVRALAQENIRTLLPAFSCPVYYRQYLDGTHIDTGAILGLGETGIPSDCDALEHYVQSDRSSIVRAAMMAVMRLDAERYIDSMMNMMENPNHSVARTAYCLVARYEEKDYVQLLSLFHSTASPYAKACCAHLLYKAPKWQSIQYVLHTLSDNDDSVRDISLRALHKWLICSNRSFVQATHQQKETIRQMILDRRERLPAQMVRELLFLVSD